MIYITFTSTIPNLISDTKSEIATNLKSYFINNESQIIDEILEIYRSSTPVTNLF